ncbi:MAG TPA: 16S rRNA (cytidine(1402)-2'-O)-methyltransferase [Bryobacteraceae bacterium]|nr:16S rRNA (cytidine(1402)-2'-O)-methyltransferase [Bryobacteraceae bacterium]
MTPFQLPFHRTTVTGTLYIVATPIGNLEDITLRARRILRECDWIACEDTRQTRKLLEHLNISRPLVSYYEHNEAGRAGELVAKLEAGANVALVSDAGTPLISDPGYRVVTAAIDAGIPVVPIPGVTAAVSALSASGLATDSFRFCGFLPARTSQRRKMLEHLKQETCTLVFYETPHRILDALKDVEAVMGSRPAVVARELTKIHEEFLRGTAAQIRATLAGRPSVKGEITLLIGKAEAAAGADDTPLEDAVRNAEEQGLSRMDAIKQVAKKRGLSKREVYRTITAE